MDVLVENLIDQYYILAKGEEIEKVDEYISLGTGIKSSQKDFEEIFDAFYREEERFNKLR